MTPNTIAPEPEKMSLNLHDQVWIKRLFDRQDEAITKQHEEAILLITDSVFTKVAEVMREQNERMFEILNLQNQAIAAIASDITDIKRQTSIIEKDIVRIEGEINCLETDVKNEDDRIGKLERTLRPRNIYFRIMVAVILAVTISMILFEWFHNHVYPVH
jgi:septal ring factor EnvC (AmiA/AmiB activator)